MTNNDLVNGQQIRFAIGGIGTYDGIICPDCIQVKGTMPKKPGCSTDVYLSEVDYDQTDYIESDTCLIVTPLPGTYKDMQRDDVIRSYLRLSEDDFGKQFETSEEIEMIDSEVLLTGVKMIQSGKEKRATRIVAPYTKIDSWNGQETRKSLVGSLIYRELDGFPIGEFIAIRNKNSKEATIVKDLTNYFKNAGWKVRKYYSGGSLVMPRFRDDPEDLLECEPSVLLEMFR